MIIWIPPQLVTILTSPGIMVHEIAHKLFCDLFNLKVYKVCYLNVGSEVGGYVVHERSNTFHIDLLIGIAPLMVNTLVCMLLTFPHSISTLLLGTSFGYATSSAYYAASIVLYALGIIIGTCAFPSKKDLSSPEELAQTVIQASLVAVLGVISQIFNSEGFGILLRGFFALCLTKILPHIFIMMLNHW